MAGLRVDPFGAFAGVRNAESSLNPTAADATRIRCRPALQTQVSAFNRSEAREQEKVRDVDRLAAAVGAVGRPLAEFVPTDERKTSALKLPAVLWLVAIIYFDRAAGRKNPRFLRGLEFAA